MMDTEARLKEARDAIQKYGARLGIVEPLMHSIAVEFSVIDGAVQTLRAEGRYDLSDRLRDSLAKMRFDYQYAFPGREA